MNRDAALATPGFGDVFTDHMVTMRWTAEMGWQATEIGPLTPMSFHPPATMALHYGQTIFEGMKAFWRPDGQRAVFRPPATMPAGSTTRRAGWPCPRCPKRTSSRRSRRWCGPTPPGCPKPVGTTCTCGRS